MFKFLKNKIQEAVKKFSKSAKEEQVEEEIEVEQEVQQPIQEETTPPQEESKKELEDKEKPEEVEQEPVVEEEPKNLDEELTVEEELVADRLTPQEQATKSEPEVIEMVEPETKETPEEKIEEELDEELPDELEELAKEESVQEQEEVEQEKELVESTSDLFESPEEEVEDEKPEEVEQEPEQVVEEPVIEEEPKEPVIDEELPVEELLEEIVPEEKEKKGGFFKRIFGGKKEAPRPEEPVIDEPIVDELAEDIEQAIEEPVQEPQPVTKEEVVPVAVPVKSAPEFLDEDVEDATKKKKGFFTKLKEKVVKFKLTEEKFEEIFWDFELALLENNVALEVIEKVKKDMHDQLTQENVTRKSADQVILDTLKDSLDDVLSVETFDFIEKIKSKKPYVITMVGVNGSGKTTTLAKIINLLQKNNLSVVVAASDTFRAAAIQQLEEHTNKLGVKLIKHDYNADPSAVAFDAISHAKAKNIDVVLIDTAGRLQSNSNLMDELKKLIRVNKPDLNIFIGESVTGNDCVEQAMAFNDAVGIDGIILSKADIDEKGGAAISVSYVTKKPILYIGTGQTYDDLKPFSKDEILSNLGL